jgi:hypothetical protein
LPLPEIDTRFFNREAARHTPTKVARFLMDFHNVKKCVSYFLHQRKDHDTFHLSDSNANVNGILKWWLLWDARRAIP